MFVLRMAAIQYPKLPQTPKASTYYLQLCGQPITWKTSSDKKRVFVMCFDPVKQNKQKCCYIHLSSRLDNCFLLVARKCPPGLPTIPGKPSFAFKFPIISPQRSLLGTEGQGLEVCQAPDLHQQNSKHR